MTDCAASRHDGQDQPTPAETGARLCAGCVHRIRRDLHRLPALDADLEQLLDPRRAGAAGGGDGGLPYHEPAAECRSQIRHDLQVWVSWVLDERQPSSCPVLTLPAMCGWLAGWTGWISRRPWAPHMAGALASDRGRAIALLDPMPAAEITLPPDVNHCPRCGRNGTMYATIYQAPGDRRPSSVTCGDCAHVWDVVQWLHLGRTILAWRDTRRRAAAA